MNSILSFLLKKHQKRVEIWKRKFKINNYHLFWMGFGEGILIGTLIGFIIRSNLYKIYN